MLYQGLLEGIKQGNNLPDEAAFSAHLRDLQGYARNLWESYRTQNVLVDYADRKIQEAYLLRYLPFYWIPLKLEMHKLYQRGNKLPATALLEAAFFGCGPGPEILGLIDFLDDIKSPTTTLSAHLVDSATETWAYSRDLVLEHIAKPVWAPSKRVDYAATAACLTDRETLASTAIDGCQLAVVQNCLNELPERQSDCVVENLMSQFARLAPGAIVLVIDRAGYDKTDRMMQYMYEIAEKSEKFVSLNGGEPQGNTACCRKMLSSVPPVVTDNLFWRSSDGTADRNVHGLRFATKIAYVSMAFQVR